MTVLPGATPPLAGYGILTGQLFLYGRGLAAFESSPSSNSASASPSPSLPLPEKKCILIGGLSDGLLPVPYTDLLDRACRDNGWSLVQPVLSSSYLGFGHGTLDRDSAELEELMRYLSDHRNAREFAMVGHSTGCQDAVHFLKHAAPELRSRISLVALQAPVSDREGTELEEGFAPKLRAAEELVADGRGDEMLPRSFHWAPITARRYVDLHARGGRDDYFSSDYTDEELLGRLGHVGGNAGGDGDGDGDAARHPDLRVLVAYSGRDEYVPSHVDKVGTTRRLVDAMNGSVDAGKEDSSSSSRVVAESLYLATGNHNLSEGDGDAEAFVQRISELFRR